MSTPRVRMFAGPNGSGKSTLNTVLDRTLLGVYINPDEIEKTIRRFDFLDLSAYRTTATQEEIDTFFSHHPLIQKADLTEKAALLRVTDNRISFFEVMVNSYFASVCADFIRHKLLEQRVSFTFETVMSSTDKIAFLQKAQQAGYRTYLYYIATQDPALNISRVKHRAAQGGHDVPDEKIISRYYRSLDLLADAVRCSDRAYIFDNSGRERLWVAQIDGGIELEYKTAAIPQWVYKYLTAAHNRSST